MKCDLLFPTTVFNEVFDLNNQEIISYAYKLKEENIGVTKTNYGGWQSEDNFISEPVNFKLLRKISNFLQEVRDFLRISDNLIIDGGWININGKNDFNYRHVHPRSLFSGVYYLQCNENSGKIILHTPLIAKEMLDPNYEELIPNLNSNTIMYAPKVNQCILFPAWIEHSVEPNQSEEDRISIAFNVFYKGIC